MRTTGYALREAAKRHVLRRDTVASLFKDSLRKFPDEKKMAPRDIVWTFEMADRAIAVVQVWQMRYNLAVKVVVQGETITLAEAIKRLGGAGRAEKMWRSAAAPPDDRGYGRDDIYERDTTKIRSELTLDRLEAAQLANKAATDAGELRAAIAIGNATEIDLEGLSADLID